MPNVNNTNVSPQTKAIKNSYPGGLSLSLGTNKPLYSPASTNNQTSTTSSMLSANGMAPKPTASSAQTTVSQPTTQYKSTGTNAGIDPYTLKPYTTSGTTSTTNVPTASPTTVTTPPPPTSLYQQAVSKLADTASKPSDQYTNLTGDAAQAYRNAGNFGQDLGQKVYDVQHDPNLSLDTGIGRSGAISASQGLKMNNLTSVASGLNSLADTANTQQGLQQSGQSSVVGATAPQAYGLNTQPYNPVENTYGGGGTQGALDRASLAGKISATQTLSQNYQAGQAQLRAANNIEPQIVATLTNNPTLNNTPLSAITNIHQWLSGQTSDPAQQQLSSQVASYIQALGMTPDQAAQIAAQKGGTIVTLLKTLKDNFTAQNEANNPANVSSNTNTSFNGSSANPWH